MKKNNDFLKLLEFFQSKAVGTPGDFEYDNALCRCLVQAADAEEGSIWRLDNERQLHLVYSTDISRKQRSEFVLREGEGIAGAAALARQTIVAADAWAHPYHDRRVDKRLDFRTRSMVSAPILFKGILYGVINILNFRQGTAFPLEWKERLAVIGVLYGAALAEAGRLTRTGLNQKAHAVPKRGAAHPLENRSVIVGISPLIQEGLSLCLKAGKTDMPVLITGESGTGKELAARRIHEAGERARGPFLAVNCAAMTETLLESELFGHVKGAFTGATHDRRGKFIAASGGTLFLDEIGDMIPASQAKILRALEEKKVTPLGSEKAVPCDARIIAATNQDLLKMTEQGEFRKDLFYRLCGIEITMPPLRRRAEDIHLLARHFLAKAMASQAKKSHRQAPLRLSPEAHEALLSFNWPGNIRQLEQAIFAAAAICEGDEIKPEDFPAWLIRAVKPGKPIAVTPPAISSVRDGSVVPNEDDARLYDQRARYVKALNGTKYVGTGRWNISAAARELNIPRKTFAYRLKKLNLIQ